MRSVVKGMTGIVLLLAILAAGFIGFMWIDEYKPAPVEVLQKRRWAKRVLYDTVKIVSWNIGYAGLGDDMDFFYDGGRSTRTTKNRTEENLQGIIAFLHEHRDADFILLQEVDVNARRSYHINEYERLRKALPDYHACFTFNYNTLFVPIPLSSPMGRVQSGLALFSLYAPGEVLRYQYPGSFPFPVRLFNLKRAVLSARFPMKGGGDLYINNTHNSAYDDGEMRRLELGFLDSLMRGRPYTITMGDWNANPPGYEPYRAGVTTETLLDFALLSPRIQCLSLRVIDLGYKNSDHNPVVALFRVRHE